MGDRKIKIKVSTYSFSAIDIDNPEYIGDIGVISCPHPDNFAVAIRSDFTLGEVGARNVKGINLAPSNSNYYSNIINSHTSGVLVDELVVQADGSGNGGEVYLEIGSGINSADMTIQKVNKLTVGGVASGTIVIDEVTHDGLHML